MATTTADLLRLSAACATASAAWATVRAENLDGAATPLNGPAVSRAANLTDDALDAFTDAGLSRECYPETYDALRAALKAYGNLQAARAASYLADAAMRLAFIAANADR